MILPSKTNTKDIKHEKITRDVFDDVKIDGVELKDFFDLTKIREKWLEKHRAYPVGLETKKVHKVILHAGKGQYVDGLNGDKNRYVVFPAYHLETKYEYYIRNTFHPIMFPVGSFSKMWDAAILYDFDKFSQSMLEIHFVKKNRHTYDAKYICVVHMKDDHHFVRTKELYKDMKYKGDKI